MGGVPDLERCENWEVKGWGDGTEGGMIHRRILILGAQGLHAMGNSWANDSHTPWRS